MNWWESFKANGYNLTDEQRKRFTRPIVVLSGLLVALFAGFLFGIAGSVKEVTEPGFDRAFMSTVVGYRAMVAMPLTVGAMLLFGIYLKAIDKTALGKRLMHWNDEWSDIPKGATVVATAMVASALLGGLLVVVAAILGGAK